MIFIDPSELRKTSNLVRYIMDMVYSPLPNLEALTGADVMISPSKMPLPRNRKIILSHIKNGARLIQIKFGHDLPGSIVDGRLNEALARMQSCGALPCQCLLLFIGMIGYDDARGYATINGQLSYSQHPMSWKQVDSALLAWIDRGGCIDFPLPSGKRIPEHFANIQRRIDMYASGDDTKLVWPKKERIEVVTPSSNKTYRQLGIGQKIEIIDDLRVLLCAIPGAKIGPDRATSIWNWMKDNEVRQDFRGFLDIVESKELLEVPGIGKGTLRAINRGLFETLEERSKKNV